MEFLWKYQFSFWLQGKSAGLFLHKWKSCYTLKGLGAGERCNRHSSDQQEAYNFLISWQRSYRYLHKYKNIHSCKSESGCFLHFALWGPYLPYPTEWMQTSCTYLKPQGAYTYMSYTVSCFHSGKRSWSELLFAISKMGELNLRSQWGHKQWNPDLVPDLCPSTAYCDFLLNNVSI